MDNIIKRYEEEILILEDSIEFNIKCKDLILAFKQETRKSMIVEFLKVVKENERELLIQFFKHFRDNGERNIGMTIEQFVDDFLNIKTITHCECGFNERMALDCTSKPCRYKGVFTSS